jgi:hypothetical protein
MHSLMEKTDFESREKLMAEIFGSAAKAQKVG